jgi:hypothetical protein
MSKELKIKVYDKDLGRDDVLGEVEWDLCKLKMGHGPKDIEKTVRRAASDPRVRVASTFVVVCSMACKLSPDAIDATPSDTRAFPHRRST